MTTKLSGAEGLEEMVLQPAPVMLTGLGWGPLYGAVVRHVEQYEGETKVRVQVQGDMAIVQFINMDWVAKFRGSESNSWLRGAGWRWGRK